MNQTATDSPLQFLPQAWQETPDWRYEQARAPVGNSRLVRIHTRNQQQQQRGGDEATDPEFAAAQAYFRRCRQGQRGPVRAAQLYPTIATVEAIQQNPGLNAQLRILVLGDCAPAEIAQWAGHAEPVVETWERLCFDVRKYRDSSGWLLTHVIQPELDQGRGDFVARLKSAACGGPAVAWAIVKAESRVPVTEGERAFDQQIKFNLKFQEAIEASFETERDKLHFVRFFAELNLAQQRLEFQKQKFAARCRQELQAQELAKLRLEAVAEREQQRAQERLQQRRHKQAQRDAEQWKREQQRQYQQQAARQRAVASPLAGVSWSTGDRSPLEPTVYQPEQLAPFEEAGPATVWSEPAVCSEPAAYTEPNIHPVRLDHASAAETHTDRGSDALPSGAVAAAPPPVTSKPWRKHCSKAELAACRRHSVDHTARDDRETEPGLEPGSALRRAQPQQAMVAACV